MLSSVRLWLRGSVQACTLGPAAEVKFVHRGAVVLRPRQKGTVGAVRRFAFTREESYR